MVVKKRFRADKCEMTKLNFQQDEAVQSATQSIGGFQEL
jgi:hypothetical protein